MKKILFIDDDQALCEEIKALLTQHGYETLLAHSARDGLRLTLSQCPDLIITDVLMETDTAGFELLYQLRDERPDSRYRPVRDTPLIFLSAIHQITHFRFSLGERRTFLPPNSGFLTKPAQKDELLALIANVLNIPKAETGASTA